MKEIPNAETYLNDKSSEIPSKYKDLNAFLHDSQIAEIMIEFAKLHVEAQAETIIDKMDDTLPMIEYQKVRNAYPLDLIK